MAALLRMGREWLLQDLWLDMAPITVGCGEQWALGKVKGRLTLWAAASILVRECIWHCRAGVYL